MTQKAAVILLDEVRARRARAKHIRALAARAVDAEIIDALRAYAAGIERRAGELEERVVALGNAAALAAALSESISSAIVETRHEVTRLRSQLEKR